MGRGHGGKGVRMCGARLGRVGGRRAGGGALPGASAGWPAVTPHNRLAPGSSAITWHRRHMVERVACCGGWHADGLATNASNVLGQGGVQVGNEVG